MADTSDSNANRLRYSQVIETPLLAMGSVTQMEDDLDYAAQVTRRAVANLKAYERKVDFHHLTEHDKMKAMLTLNTIYALQSKVLKNQADKERESHFAALSSGKGPNANSAPLGRITSSNQNHSFLDASNVSAASPGRSAVIGKGY